MSRPLNDNFLRALLKEPTDYTPIWLMRQAGRYLPEYRATRQRAGDFLTLCKTPSLACEVSLQPLARYALDAAIIFSDILTIPDAMGLGLHFVEGEGPKFLRPCRDESAIYSLVAPDPAAHLSYVLDTVSEVKRALNNAIPLIGFAGSPYTLASYMIEGGSSKDWREVHKMRRERPDLLHHLLSVLADSVIDYLNAQIESGVQAVMIFDSWGGVLSDENYLEFSLAYLQRIIDGIKKEHAGEKIPSILFTKGGGKWLEVMANTGCTALSVDSLTELDEARRRVGQQVALQGNLAPEILLRSPDEIVQQAQKILQSYGSFSSGHVFNLGHGVLQTTPPDNVLALVEAVHGFSQK